MKKEIIFLILLFFLPFIFIFSTTEFFYTQDGWTHLARSAAFFKALQDGQIPVRFAGDLNYSYGMPLFDFAFHMPYILMSIFIFFGSGLVNALKITTLLSFIFSGVFMYIFAKEFFKDTKKALTVTIFYQFFPFRLVEMFVRGSVGEMLVFSFFPVILYGVVLLYNKFSFRALLCIAFGTAGAILSHLATGAVFLSISVFFILFFAPKIKQAILAICSIFLGLCLSAYYWLPAILDHKYTYGSLFAKDLYASHFAPFINFFIPNFFNDPSLRIGDVSIQIGLFHLVAFFTALLFIIFSKKAKIFEKKLFIFCLVIILASFFIMQPISIFIWKNVPLFEQFQFPWRFLGSMGFAMSLLAVYFFNFSYFKKKIVFFVLIFLTITTTVYYWYPQLGFRKVDENYYWNYPLDTTYFGETNLIWSAGSATSYPKKPVEVIGGQAEIYQIHKKSNLHVYQVDAKTDSSIIDHTQFFPGWKVFVDGKETNIQFQDQLHRGEITFFVPKGKHEIKVVFGETKIRIIADNISLFSLLFIILFIALQKFFKHKIKYIYEK